MKIVCNTSDLDQALKFLRKKKGRLAYVPTMGALHKGHISLIQRANRENTHLIVSIFVNPMQFGPREDYLAYPQTRKSDIRKCRKAGVDLLFMPEKNFLSNNTALRKEDPGSFAKGLCGRFRPGHFRGVVRIVALFFRLIQPDTVYVGEKDYQQYRVIDDMVRKIFRPGSPKIIACTIIREKSGLAMSSRNAYLNKQEKNIAQVIYRMLKKGRDSIREGKSIRRVLSDLRNKLIDNGFSNVDYFICCESKNLKPIYHISKNRSGELLLAVRARLGKVALIDNIRFPV